MKKHVQTRNCKEIKAPGIMCGKQQIESISIETAVETTTTSFLPSKVVPSVGSRLCKTVEASSCLTSLATLSRIKATAEINPLNDTSAARVMIQSPFTSAGTLKQNWNPSLVGGVPSYFPQEKAPTSYTLVDITHLHIWVAANPGCTRWSAMCRGPSNVRAAAIGYHCLQQTR